jgi:4-hydroxybenzoate polyprenyltransferase
MVSKTNRPQPAGYVYYRLVVGALAALLGLGIVVRGVIGHSTPLYIASGGVFVAFGLWRLKQWSDERRRKRS